MPQYKADRNTLVAGTLRKKDEVFECDAETAAPAVASGALVLVEATEGEQSPPLAASAPAGPTSETETGNSSSAPAAPTQPAVPDGFPQQPTPAQIEQDIASIEGPGPQSSQQLN